MTADPSSLYVIAAGSNDMRDARNDFPDVTPTDGASRLAAAATAVGNLSDAIGFLASKGARHFLVPNLSDLGATPEAAGLGLVDASTDATLKFNALLAGMETALDGAGLDVTILDLFGLGGAIGADALTNGGAVYGITNVFAPCGSFPGSLGASCDASLYSDGLHPTARAHGIAGAAALAALGIVAAEPPPAAVPAPASALLLLGAIGVLSAGSRGRSGGRSRATA